MNKIITICFAFYILVSTFHIAEGQDTIYVPQDYDLIQQAIDASVNGNIVLVDTGVYEENINFNGKAITVKSYYDPPEKSDSSYIYNTIIDGSKPVDTNKASVVTFPIWSDTNSVISGFTIMNGKGTLLGNRLGGGILCFDGGKIIHNKIINNTVVHDEHALGSGIWAEGLTSSIFVIKNNIIENNQLENTNSSYMCWGTIGLHTGNIIVKNNIIRSNTAKGRPYGVGIYLNNVEGLFSHNLISYDTGYHTLAGKSRGGGMYVVNVQPGLEISNNEITHNKLIWLNGGGNFRYGGGIAVLSAEGFEYNALLIDKNIIYDNIALLGAGISITEVYNITISNNVIRDNEAEMDGGGIFIQNLAKGNENLSSYNNSSVDPMPVNKSLEKPLLVNNTIINNHADFGGGIYSMMYEEEFIAFNNIIYGNTAATMGPDAFIEGNCSGYFYNNNIDTNDIGGSGTWSGADNIIDDPKFEDEDGHILWNSPCIGMGLDSIKLEGKMHHCPDHDFDGEQRPQAALVDIGADETPYWVKVNEPHMLPVQISVYPNPASEIISLLIQPGTEAKSIEIIDIQGKVVLHQEETGNAFSIDVSSFPNGIYFVRIHTSEGVGVEKLVVR